MADQPSTAEHVLMQQIGIDAENIERRKRCVGLGADDLRRIVALRDLVTRDREQYAAKFFDFLAPLEEARPLFANREGDAIGGDDGVRPAVHSQQALDLE